MYVSVCLCVYVCMHVYLCVCDCTCVCMSVCVRMYPIHPRSLPVHLLVSYYLVVASVPLLLPADVPA